MRARDGPHAAGSARRARFSSRRIASGDRISFFSQLSFKKKKFGRCSFLPRGNAPRNAGIRRKKTNGGSKCQSTRSTSFSRERLYLCGIGVAAREGKGGRGVGQKGIRGRCALGGRPSFPKKYTEHIPRRSSGRAHARPQYRWQCVPRAQLPRAMLTGAYRRHVGSTEFNQHTVPS